MADNEKAENKNPWNAHETYTQAYVNILNTYNTQIEESIKKRNTLKDSFFNMINLIMKILIFLFTGSVVASFIVFVFMIIFKYNSSAVIAGAITGMISSFVTMLLSIFKLPQIIAEYLFNKEEDRMMSEVIKNIQTYEIDVVKAERLANSASEKDTTGKQTVDVSIAPSSKNTNTVLEDDSALDDSPNSASDDTQDSDLRNG